MMICSFSSAPGLGEISESLWTLPSSLPRCVISERLNALLPGWRESLRVRRSGKGQVREVWQRQAKEGEGQAWSSMGKTKRVPRLSSSCSRESSSRSSASSEVLPLLLPFALQPDPASAPPPPPDAPLAVMAVSPNMKVRSPSLRRRSESWSLSCSWFWKHIHSGTKGGGMENMGVTHTHTHRCRTHRVGLCGVKRWTDINSTKAHKGHYGLTEEREGETFT